MGLRAARGLHLALILLGALLYLFFVLPRWWVLTGDVPSTLATAGRLAAGIPIALAALPVLTILRQSLGRKVKPPELALRLRAWSAVLHVVAGALILLAAVVEIWLHLGAAGPYLFAVYGAAASIAILAVLALYLSFVAEKPPAPPKPPKPPKPKKVKAEKVKAEKKPRRGKGGAAVETEDAAAAGEAKAAEAPNETVDTEVVTETVDTEVVDALESADTVVDTDDAAELETAPEASDAAPSSSGLLNKRPAGKRRYRLGR